MAEAEQQAGGSEPRKLDGASRRGGAKELTRMKDPGGWTESEKEKPGSQVELPEMKEPGNWTGPEEEPGGWMGPADSIRSGMSSGISEWDSLTRKSFRSRDIGGTRPTSTLSGMDMAIGFSSGTDRTAGSGFWTNVCSSRRSVTATGSGSMALLFTHDESGANCKEHTIKLIPTNVIKLISTGSPKHVYFAIYFDSWLVML